MDGDWWPPGATVSAHLGRFASLLEDGSCALLLPIFHDLFTTTSGQGRGTRAVEYRREHGSQAPPVFNEVEVRPVLARAEGVGRAGDSLRGREGAGAPRQARCPAAALRAEALSGDRV